MLEFLAGMATGAILLFAGLYWYAACSPSTYDMKLRRAKDRMRRRREIKYGSNMMFLDYLAEKFDG